MPAAPVESSFEVRRADDVSISSSSHARRPIASAACMLSTTAAARPFMKTERTSFMVGGVAGRLRHDPTGMPSGTNTSANAAAPAPEARAGVPSPRSGIGPSRATSAKRAPDPVKSAAMSRLSAGDAVFRSA